MSARPLPKLTTNVNRDNVGGNRVSSTNSPLNARSPSAHSLARSDLSMTSRNKRPAEPRSRGNSPPEKRSRPHERTALQERYAIPSPPISRKTSVAALPPNVPTGPKGNSDRHRPPPSRHYKDHGSSIAPNNHDARIMSPSSIGSGASTPSGYVAPPAPSMIPAAGPTQCQEDATTELPTIQSLRNLKERKKAIAAQAKAAPVRVQESSVSTSTATSSSLQATVLAQQMEITQLKKERDDITSRLTDLETQHRRLCNVAIQLEPEDDRLNASVLLEPIRDRLNTLEQLEPASKLNGLQKGIEEIQPALGRLTALEQSQELPILRQEVEKLGSILGRVDTLEKSQTSKLYNLEKQIKPLSDRIDVLDAAQSESAKSASNMQGALNEASTELKSEIQTLKKAKEQQNIDIDASKNRNYDQRKTTDEADVKGFVLAEIAAQTSHAQAMFGEQVDKKTNATEAKLMKRIDGCEKGLTSLTSRVDSFRDNIEAKIKDVEKNDGKTYSKASKLSTTVEELGEDLDMLHKDVDRLKDTLYKDVERLDKDVDDLFNKRESDSKNHDKLRDDIAKFIGPIEEQFDSHEKTLVQRIQHLSTDTNERFIKLQNKLKGLSTDYQHLVTGQSDVTSNLTKMAARLDSIETKAHASTGALGPGFKKVGNTVTSLPVKPFDHTAITTQRMDQFDKDIKELRQALEEYGGLATKITAVEERSGRVEEEVREKAKTLDRKLEASVSAHSRQVDDARVEQPKLGEKLSNVETRVASLSNAHSNAPNLSTSPQPAAMQDILDIQQRLTDLEEDLEGTNRDVFDHETRIAGVQESVPGLFRDNFDTLRQTTEQRFASINGTLDEQGARIDRLQARPSQTCFSDSQQRQFDAIKTEAERLKQEVDEVKSLQQDAATQDRNVVSQLATKADQHTVDQQMNAFAIAVRHLTTRFENITTEELHRRMVHWFVQMYPSNEAIALRELPRIQQEIANLKNFESQVSWVKESSEDLARLVTSTPQLLGLASRADGLQALVNAAPVNAAPTPQTLEKVEQAYSDAKTALANTEKQSKDLTTTNSVVLGLQTLLRDLSSDASSFAKADALNAVQKTVVELQGLIDELNEDVKTVLKPRLDVLEGSSSQHRREFDMMNSTLIEPNRGFLGCLGAVYVTLCELQNIVKGLNQNLPPHPLEFEYQYDLAAFTKQTEVNGNNDNNNNSDKGKGKSTQ